MDWIRSHPYASGLAAAGLVFVVGVFVVGASAPVSPAASRLTVWGGGGSAPSGAAYPAEQSGGQSSRETIMQRVQSGAPYTYIEPSLPASGAAPGSQTGAFDFDAFVALLSDTTQPHGQTTGEGGVDISLSYEFVPRGLVAVQSDTSSRTPQQQALFDYGNEVGSFIQSFEARHSNEAQVLRDQAEDRTDPLKAAALTALADDLSGIGRSLQRMDTVPPAAASAHNALSASYVEIGTKLALVPKAVSDSDFVDAIQTYNASADKFIENYVYLAQLFASYGVTFSALDSGSVFTFSPIGL
ncbi:MAG: hypothetical protein NUV59_02855 [Patescibacteria group bacterium]|nr:hypothetical protein [Patescibacteria group bacterium]